MKNIKSLLYAAAAVLLLPLTSCSDDDYPLEPVPAGQEVYFSESLATNYTLARGTSSIDIPVMRIKTDEAETVQIMAEDESGLFTVPSSITFAAGADQTNLTITYDFAALEPAKTYPVSLLVMGNQSDWGQSQVKLNLAVPAPWNKLGTGRFRDDILPCLFNGIECNDLEVDIYEYDGRPGYYYVDSPYDAVYLAYLFDAEPAQLKNNVRDVQFIIDATDPDAVVIGSSSNPQDCGCILGDDGWISVYSKTPGTMKDGVITFDTDGLRACFDGAAHQGKAYYANSHGMFRVVLPGVVLQDCSMSAVYDGMKVSADGAESAALFNLSFGADVASYKYVVAEGDATAEFDTLVAAIADGTAENVNEGDVKTTTLAITLEGSGMHSFVAVPYNKAGEAQVDDAILVTFFFPGQGGAEVPDIEVALEMGFASDYLNEATAAQYPATSCLLYLIEVAEADKGAVKAVRLYLNKTDIIEGSGLTYKDILDSYGSDNANIPSTIKDSGYYLSAFTGLSSGTSYTMLVEIESTYGKKYILSAEKTTEAIPYTGELVLGNYNIVDAENESEAGFTLTNTADPNKFIVQNFLLNNKTNFYADYDSAANTLTLNGVEQGYEDDGNIFGSFYGYFNKEKDWVYAYVTASSLESTNVDDPVVFTIDPTTKKIASLNTYVFVSIYVYSTEEFVGNALIFSPASVITMAETTSSVRTKALGFAKQLVKSQNSGVKRALKSATILDREVKSTQIVENREVRTLKVKAEACARQKKSLGDLKLRAARF